MAIAIAAIGGFEALGVWNIVYRFTTVVIILMESLWRVSFPAMSRLRETGEDPMPVVERAASMASVMSGAAGGPPRRRGSGARSGAFRVALDAGRAGVAARRVDVMLAGPISAIAIGYLLSEDRAGVLLRMAICDGLGGVGASGCRCWPRPV